MRENEQKNVPNRRMKDSVFVDLFGRDRYFKENFISLYNALHGTSLSPENTAVEPEMLDSALYMSYANDVAMQGENPCAGILRAVQRQGRFPRGKRDTAVGRFHLPRGQGTKYAEYGTYSTGSSRVCGNR